MSREKIDVNDYIDSKSSSGIVESGIMKALEDIDFDITQVDIDSPNPEDIENDHFKEIERDVKNYETGEKMEKLLSQEGLAIDDPVRMYLKLILQREFLSVIKLQRTSLPKLTFVLLLTLQSVT